jgi:hypothetical protein
LERGLYRELGFESFEDYVVERLDLSPRTARRLVRLARAPEAVASAFREGRIHPPRIRWRSAQTPGLDLPAGGPYPIDGGITVAIGTGLGGPPVSGA